MFTLWGEPMSLSASIQINSTADHVFALYSDVSSWPSWDKDVLAVSLPQGLVLGSTGWLKPRGGPKVKLSVTEVTRGVSFSTASDLPLCKMTVLHSISQGQQGVNVIHQAQFTGLLAFFFAFVIGRPFMKNLPDALHSLKALAEGSPLRE